MHHKNVLDSAKTILSNRAAQYGSENECFERISQLATIMLNKSISKYDVAMIHLATKLARLQEARQHEDSYVDGVNYLAFAAQFSKTPESVETAFEDDIAALLRTQSAVSVDEKKDCSHCALDDNVDAVKDDTAARHSVIDYTPIYGNDKALQKDIAEQREEAEAAFAQYWIENYPPETDEEKEIAFKKSEEIFEQTLRTGFGSLNLLYEKVEPTFAELKEENKDDRVNKVKKVLGKTSIDVI